MNKTISPHGLENRAESGKAGRQNVSADLTAARRVRSQENTANFDQTELAITIRIETERSWIIRELIDIRHWQLSKLRASNQVIAEYNPNAGVKQAYPNGRWTI